MFKICCGLAAFLALSSPVIAQPMCYMIDSSGRTINLERMCNTSQKEATNNQERQAAQPSSSDSADDLIKVGELKDQSPIFYDKKSLTPKTFALQTLSNGVFVELEYEYACAERRVFLTKTTSYRSGLKPVVSVGGGESKFASGSAVSQGLNLACRQSMAPGY